jgi:signal transduction histidine kinase
VVAPVLFDARVTGVVLLLQAAAIVVLGLALRRRARERTSADGRLQFERLLAELSADLSTVPTDRADEAIGHWVARLGSHFEADRVALVQFSDHSSRLHPTHTSDAGPWPPLPDCYEAEELPTLIGDIRQGRVVRLSRMADLPAAAGADRATLAAAGVQALVAAPLAPGGQPIGLLAVMMSRCERHWSAETVLQLQLVAGVMGGTLLRRNNERSLRSIDALSGAVLSSLSARVAVLDGKGTVVRANEAWLAPERSNGIAWAPVGQNYLAVCRSSPEHESGATELARGIESVLAGEQSGVRLECSTSTPSGEHWYEVVAEPLRRPTGGAVVMLTDLTARKRAELEAQQHRAEAVHAARAATLGELAAGLAHELNQPLAAIATYNHSCMRMLQSGNPDSGELQQAMHICRDQAKRAGKIIQRLRDLLRPPGPAFTEQNLNELVDAVLGLAEPAARDAGITFECRLAPTPPAVRADRLLVEQVALNLVRNAIEAVETLSPERRRITVATRLEVDGSGTFSVSDLGDGVPREAKERLFDPFVTTKPGGLGLGLSICRSVVEAHGGSIRHHHNDERGDHCVDHAGAVFAFTLPGAA